MGFYRCLWMGFQFLFKIYQNVQNITVLFFQFFAFLFQSFEVNLFNMDIIFDEVDLESFKLEFCFFNEMIKNCIKILQFGDL